MSQDDPDLTQAYALETPDDSRRLYAAWADTYDSGFVGEQDYILHLHTAQAYAAAGGGGPVLDVGAGTGLCGVALAQLGVAPVDATDISGDMLRVAEAKDVYRDLFEADLTQGLPVAEDSYAGIVSSGTFTHGHLGPDALDPLMAAARPGALFAISINSQHYQKMGFEAKLAAYGSRITGLTLPEVRIYGDKADPDHRLDTALIATFRKT